MFRMYRIEKNTAGALRLLSDARLSRSDFHSIATMAGEIPRRARKSGLVAARFAAKIERIDTLWNGKETQNTAKLGDAIVTNLDGSGRPLIDAAGNQNVYVIEAEKFGDLYEPAGSSGTFQARSHVEVIALGGGFDIVAPWGERQEAASGYLLSNGTDVYGNQTATFDATYVWAT